MEPRSKMGNVISLVALSKLLTLSTALADLQIFLQLLSFLIIDHCDTKIRHNFQFLGKYSQDAGEAVAYWLVRWTPVRTARVRPLAGITALYSWARHLTLTVPLSTQVSVNCWGNLTECWRVTCDGLAFHPGGVEILLAASCYRNWDKLWLYGPLGLIQTLPFTD